MGTVLKCPHDFTFQSFTFHSFTLHLERSSAHARGCAKCRQECCERGYYHLHRQLNDPLFLHFLSLIHCFNGLIITGGRFFCYNKCSVPALH